MTTATDSSEGIGPVIERETRIALLAHQPDGLSCSCGWTPPEFAWSTRSGRLSPSVRRVATMPVDFVAERRCPECGEVSADGWLPFDEATRPGQRPHHHPTRQTPQPQTGDKT